MSDKPRILVTRRHLAEIEARLTADYDVVFNEDDHKQNAWQEAGPASVPIANRPLTTTTVRTVAVADPHSTRPPQQPPGPSARRELRQEAIHV